MSRSFRSVGDALISVVALTAALDPAAATELGLFEQPVQSEVDVERSKKVPGRRSEYVVGIALNSSPEYGGASKRALSLRPVLGYRYGRFRISSSGGGGILNFGQADPSGGASADLIESDRWKLRASLRIGGGRTTVDSSEFADLTEIDRTVFGRLSASITLAPNWHVASALNWDLLSRGNGVSITTGLGYGRSLSPTVRASANVGLSFGNATHMNGLFGVPASAQQDNRPAFSPRSGVKDASIGLSMISAIKSNWFVFGGIGISRLLGEAASSPLTRRSTGVSFRVGVAWRCCL